MSKVIQKKFKKTNPSRLDTVSEFLGMFTQDECWYWVGKTGAPTLKSFMDTALELSCTKYTTERDEH